MLYGGRDARAAEPRLIMERPLFSRGPQDRPGIAGASFPIIGTAEGEAYLRGFVSLCAPSNERPGDRMLTRPGSTYVFASQTRADYLARARQTFICPPVAKRCINSILSLVDGERCLKSTSASMTDWEPIVRRRMHADRVRSVAA